MFTGLIEDVGRVAALESRESGARLGVRTRLTAELGPGDSVAVNGVCLTAVEGPAGCAWFDLSPQTLAVTALGSLVPGAAVNLERALKADARLGGHFVLGHVDGVACLTAMAQDGDFERLSIELPRALAAFLIPRGSVAIDGISLTVADLRSEEFDVQIVPHTWSHTNLSERRPGDRVNLEVDVLGKYVLRALEVRLPGSGADRSAER